MKVSLFNCWYCEKRIVDNSKNSLQKYTFWCNKRCHDKYVKETSEASADQVAWSNYMGGDAECPEHLQHLLPKVEEIDFEPEPEPQKTKNKKGKKSTKGKRICGNCGKPGHNARTCGRKKKKPTKKHSKAPSGRTKSGRKQYQCRVCQEYGHNARTCPKK